MAEFQGERNELWVSLFSKLHIITPDWWRANSLRCVTYLNLMHYHGQIYDPPLHSEELPASNQPERAPLRQSTECWGGGVIHFPQHQMTSFTAITAGERKDTARRRPGSAAGCRCSEESGAGEWHLMTHRAGYKRAPLQAGLRLHFRGHRCTTYS